MKSKIILLIALFLILALPICFAFNIDNIKTYNSTDRSIIVKNSFLGIPTTEIAKITPTTPHNTNVFPGAEVLVAEFDIESYDNYNEKFWQGMNFYDLKKGGRQIARNYVLKQLDRTEEIRTQIERIDCSHPKEYAKDGTAICEHIITGYETTQNKIWKKIDSSENMKKEKIHIGIFAEVKDKDYIEFVPTWFGVYMPEYSTWTATLNDALLHYWKLDEGNNSDQTDSVGGANALRNDPLEPAEITGIINKGLKWNNINLKSLNYSNLKTRELSNNFSVSFWFNIIGTNDYSEYITGGYSGTGSWAITQRVGGNMILTKPGIAEVGCSVDFVPYNNGWHQIVMAVDKDSTLRMYFDGKLNCTGTSTSFSSTSTNGYIGAGEGLPFTAWMDEVAIWNRSLTASEVTQLYNGGVGITQTTIFLAVQTNLSAPADNTKSALTSYNFMGNITASNGNLTNASLYLWKLSDNSLYSTDTTFLSGTQANVTFNKNLIVDNYLWNIYGCANDSLGNFECKFAAANFSLNITKFKINTILSSPPNNSINLGTINFLANLSVVDNSTYAEISSAVIYIYNLAGQIVRTASTAFAAGNGSVTASFNLGGFGNASYFWNINGCGINSTSTICAYAGANYTFSTYDFKILNVTYDKTILSSSTNTYQVNVSYDASTITTITPTLVYNGTSYSSTASAGYTNYVIYNFTLLAPFVSSSINKSFYFNFLAYNSTGLAYNLNTSVYNQTIEPILADNCTLYSNVVLNYSIKDELTQAMLGVGNISNITFKIDLKFGGFINQSFAANGQNPILVCLNKNLTSPTRLDAQVQYGADNYVLRFNNIQGAMITQAMLPLNYTLFALPIINSQSFLLTIKDATFLPLTNVVVEVTKKYIDEGVFKLVESPLTDNQGQAIAHLILEDAIYTIIIKRDGVILGTFENVYASCQNPTSNQCTLNLNLIDSTGQPDDFMTLKNLIYSIAFNESTRVASSLFSTQDGTQATILLNVTNVNSGALICSNSVITSAGQVQCSIPASAGNITISAALYSNGNFINSLIYTIKGNESNKRPFGLTGIVFAIILYMILPLFFIGSPVMMIIGGIMALVLSVLLLLLSGGILGYGAVIIWFIIAGCAIIYRIITKGGQQ